MKVSTRFGRREERQLTSAEERKERRSGREKLPGYYSPATEQSRNCRSSSKVDVAREERAEVVTGR